MKKILTGICLLVQIVWTISVAAQNQVTPQTALQQYLNNGDKSYSWELKDSVIADGATAYTLLLHSQKWHQYNWKHQLSIVVPAQNIYDGALLFITGGSNNKETQTPNWSNKNDDLIKLFSTLAIKNKAIVAVLRQVPNQPIFDSLTEDAAISYTLHQFKKDNDHTWPLLFPMVKSAVRAMDAVQEFSNIRFCHAVNRFVVSGASKRGWTTWLTGASDPRVAAIGPMVIDILNMPVNLQHQINAYGKYSVEIEDYVKLGIVQGMGTEEGKSIVTMIDPYSYRKSITMPKMIFIGTNDPYWVIDNVKNYLKDIPGYNMLHCAPNAGHGLNKGITAFPALSAFFGTTMRKEAYPLCIWKTSISKHGVKLSINATQDKLKGVVLWSADSKDMDFRDEKFESRDLGISNQSKIVVVQPLPKNGYRAFYVDLRYSDPNGGEYTVSTRVFMTNTKKIL